MGMNGRFAVGHWMVVTATKIVLMGGEVEGNDVYCSSVTVVLHIAAHICQVASPKQLLCTSFHVDEGQSVQFWNTPSVISPGQ